MTVFKAYTPHARPEHCTFGLEFWAISKGASRLLCHPMEASSEDAAIAQAEAKADAVAVVALHHSAYNTAPDIQTRANWVLEAAATGLSEPYATQR